VRLHLHLRITGHVQSLVRRARRAAVTLAVLILVFGSLIVGKNIFLGELRTQIRKTLRYGALRMSFFPPAIIIENLRSLPDPPMFRAKMVRVELPFTSLLRNEKSVTVLLEGPEIDIRPGELRTGSGGTPFPVSLPFAVSRGLIRDGTVVYESESVSVKASELKALFTQGRAGFELKADSDKLEFASVPDKMSFHGTFGLTLTGKGEDIRIRKLTVEGPSVALKAEGHVRNLSDPEIDLDVRADVDMAEAAELLQLPFTWTGRAGGVGKLSRERGAITVGADITSDGLVLSGVPMGRIRGRLDFTPQSGGQLDLNIQRPNLPAESLSLSIRAGRVEGRAKGVSIEPVMRYIQVAWPVKSPVWGTFTFDRGRLDVAAEFRDQILDREGDRFSFRGGVEVHFDVATQKVEIQTPGLESAFARLDARADFRLNGDIDAEIRGTVRDLKQTREFVSLALDETFDFPEIRGAGYADVRLTGSTLDPQVLIKGSFAPAGFDLFNAALVDGEAVISGQDFRGDFHVDDPDLKADIRISVDPQKTDADIQNAEADIAKVFAGLVIPVRVQGRASGRFHVVQTLTSQDVTGTFSSPEISAYGEKAREVKGSMEWKDGDLSFPEIGFGIYGGRVQGRAMLGLVSRAFDADVKAEGIDLAALAPGTGGLLSLSLSGRGVFGKDRLTGQYTVQNLLLPPLQKTEASGEIALEYVEDQVSVDATGRFAPGDNEVQALFKIPVSRDALIGTLKGHWTNLDLLLPWTGAKGRLEFTAEVSGPRSSPHVSSTVNFQGPVMPFPRFPQAVNDYSGTVRIEDGKLTVSELKGKFGGGDVTGSGEIGLGPSGVETIDMNMSGKDMQVAPLERTRALVDGEARLIKDSRQFVLDGDFLIKKLVWRRELSESFSFSSAALYETKPEPSFFDDMTLNIRLRATENALMDNSLGRVTGRFDLNVTGSIEDPVLLGDIEIQRGTFVFQDQNFRILKGRVSFTNPASTEPYLEVRAETYVKDYRVTMSLTGLPSRLKPEFSSSPPLPPEDVLALLAMGEAFKSTYSYTPERSTTLSTASLLSFQIADQAKKRAEGLFSLDRFRIDPFVTGSSSEMTARLTVGKKLSRNLIFIYSTNLATQRDEIYRMEWEVRSDFSLVAVRNELGRLSFDLKYRKRF
jgi:autotransporter translocation and assembly factor TamB